MPERLRVIVAEPKDFSPKAVALLEEAGLDVELRACTQAELPGLFEAYDVVWIRLGVQVDAQALGSQPRCRVLACPVTGLDHIDLKVCAARGVRVVSLKGETEFLKEVRATAELTVALLLSLIRHLPRAASSVVEGAWDRDRFRGGEIYRKTAGVVGMGRLGTIVAGYLHSMGMEVIGFDPRVSEFPTGVARAPSLEALLGRSDVISLHVSYEPETHHMIGASELAKVKPGAVLINTSRGGLIHPGALVAALESGQLAGAALDVLEGEPDVEGSPLLAYAREHTNLLITPHIGGNTRESFEKTECFVARKVLESVVA